MDRGAWQGYSLWVTKESDMTEHALTMHTCVLPEGLEVHFLTV